MAFNGYLTNQELNELTTAAVDGGLLAVPRQTLLSGIPPAYVAALPLAGGPLDQFVLDLVQTNYVERMAGGEVPVITLLQNAAARLRLEQRAQAGVFEQILSRVGNVAAGVQSLPDPAQLPEVVRNEKIIGFDDTVDIRFLGQGLDVARAVAMISVPRFENGTQIMIGDGPWVMRGTAWLIAPNFAITNHHVINARLDGEPDAADADLRLQAEGATLRFDFDAEDADGQGVKTRGLASVSLPLDYALVELADAGVRPIPRLALSPVEVDSTSRMAVNIIQHPRGEHKRIAFRNNLVSGADARIVRYFTDTDQGSSGSPVCDDRWRVVALHRGARYTNGVEFQGKREAYVNFGSQIHTVLGDIRDNNGAAADAITTAQAGS